jgi:hypothetical protein
MARQVPKPLPPVGAARVIEAAPGDDAGATIIEHPDGWYWVAAGGRQQFGPFRSAAEARADCDRYDERMPEPGESLYEAESELGIADWIDPDTGEPAEGLARPHLPDD